MDRGLELAAIDGVAQEARPSPATPSHTRADCPNCGARLHGRYCHDCGQSADDHHRSIGHLAWEAVEGLTHLDGRLAQTLPALLFRPGRLARDHIEGRRQRHVPPFRLFLISLLIFMFAAEFAVSHGERVTVSARAPQSFRVGRETVVTARPDQAASVLAKDPEVAKSPVARWFFEHAGRAGANREYFTLRVFEWAHRLAVAALPILAGLLTLVYVYKRQFYVYDHLVVAMQYLSFCFLVWAPVWVLPKLVSDWLWLALLVWTPLNLYQILRAAYGSRRIGAAVKAVALWVSTLAVFALLLTGLLAYALNEM